MDFSNLPLVEEKNNNQQIDSFGNLPTVEEKGPLVNLNVPQMTPEQQQFGQEKLDKLTGEIVQTGGEIAKDVALFPIEHPLPFIGSMVFGATPLSSAVGFGAGTFIEKQYQNLTGESLPQWRILLDTATSAGSAYFLGKGLDKVLPALGGRRFAALSEKFDKSPSQTRLNDLSVGLGNFLSNLFREIPDNQKEKYLDKLVRTYKGYFKISGAKTRRIFDRGPKTVFKKENIQTSSKGSPAEALSEKAYNTISSVGDDIVNKMYDEYETKLGSVLEETQKTNVMDIVTNIKSYLSELTGKPLGSQIKKTKKMAFDKNSILKETVVEEPIENTIANIAKKDLKYNIDKFSLKELNNIIVDINAMVESGAEVSFKQLHEYKRLLNKILDTGGFKNSPRTKEIVIRLKNDIVDKLDAENDLYRAVNNKYRDVIGFVNSHKNLSSPEKVPSFYNQYFSDDQTFFRDKVDSLIKTLEPGKQKLINSALDEEVARSFLSDIIGKRESLTLGMGPAGLQVGKFLASTPRKEMKKLLRRDVNGSLILPKRMANIKSAETSVLTGPTLELANRQLEEMFGNE